MSISSVYRDGSGRTRTTDSLSRPLLQRSLWWDTSQAGQPVYPALSAGCTQGEWSLMFDVVTPSFKLRSSRGEVINNSMSYTKLKGEILSAVGPRFTRVSGGTTQWGEYEGVYGVGGPPSAVDLLCIHIRTRHDTYGVKPNVPAMIGLASTQARANVAEPDYDGLVSLGEMKETLRYLRNPFAAGLKLADRLNRQIASMRSRKGGYTNDLASVYLEFRYAVRPLIKEVESALLNLANKSSRPKRQTARGVQNHENTYTRNVPGGAFGGDALFDQTETCSRSTSVRTGLLYEWVAEPGLADRWGMRLSDVPSAAWQLVPLSFMYDWVGNVGDYIAAMTPRAGTRALSGWTTVRTKYVLEVASSNFRMIPAGWSTARDGNGRVRYELTEFVRTPGLQSASLELRGVDNLRNDAARLLDVVSVMHQKLSNAIAPTAVRQLEQERMQKAVERMDRRQSWTSNGPSARRSRQAELQWLKAITRA